ncbi:MAG: alanine dehydrogenase [Bacteroidetes bacterium]|nr:alanine dehydrogenase [Bacteroidota bacterium]
MNIGILKEDPKRERRIALTPAAVHSLISEGATIYIEKDAGEAAHFSNSKYEEVGAKIVYTSDEIYGRSEIILKVATPTESEIERMLDSQVLFSALHLAVAKPKILESLLQKKICGVAIELLEDGEGGMPILQAMSEIAGQMSIQVAGRYLESNNNGRGILLGGLTAVPPASVVILGAGTVGQAAARMALGVGAQVIVLDKDLERLRSIEQRFDYRIITGIVNEYNIRKALKFTDVLIGAVLIKGEKAPHLVSEEMVKTMKPGAVLIDVSIDQGGCIETSRPTTLENPVYVMHDVIHYCVPNMPANVARSATYALTNSLLPYLSDIVSSGIENAIKLNIGLSKGICTFKNRCTQLSIAKRFGVEYSEINSLL